MPNHKVGTREEYQAARDELLAREKELTHQRDELTRQRLELPWVKIEKEYTFDTDEGTKTLAELFDGRSQMIIYHFMFGPQYDAGCTVCSSVAAGFDGARPHLNAKDVTFGCISRAPLEKLQAYKKRMGWSFPWASSGETEFNFDFGASNTDEELAPFLAGDIPPTVEEMAARSGTDVAGYVAEAPVLTSFALDNGDVYQTYSTTARGLEFQMTFYLFLDRAPKGRNEAGGDPTWLRRWDEY
jgi:predicted dithiol-disulfide oxidoreductase (DUF899 family)